ncbi:MAG TPA: LysR family transcriptional regulator [Eoetvoesiella sp.]|uniref:LysR family transcriptional regulator n=1 Tax=Eoetvoesiella sp. TaxID=1966355 RepID=UPI002BEF62C3|nr:LysR family transcriptional regulator [Eoetvoesiella sp.]HWK60540.1 LysR family transcriptional regulator [Eoetvoesiella sp.]
MDNIDLKLLAVFDGIYKTGNISQAAESLGIGQPAVSMSLRRLREHFNDPLFVRTSGGMAPTSLAEDLKPYVTQTLALLHTTLDYRARFDPATSERTFRVCMSDIGQVTALPALLEVIKRDAPSIRIEITTVSEHTPKLLESGEVDLAVGFMTRLDAGFYQQKLLDERFVCIARSGHARIGPTLSLRQFQEELHMVVSSSGTSDELIDRMLQTNNVQRTVAVRVPNFAGITANIENTDYLVIVPERLGLFLQKGWDIKVLPLPFEAVSYQVMQHWHERHAREPGNRWLRAVMSGIFQQPS